MFDLKCRMKSDSVDNGCLVCEMEFVPIWVGLWFVATMCCMSLWQKMWTSQKLSPKLLCLCDTLSCEFLHLWTWQGEWQLLDQFVQWFLHAVNLALVHPPESHLILLNKMMTWLFQFWKVDPKFAAETTCLWNRCVIDGSIPTLSESGTDNAACLMFFIFFRHQVHNTEVSGEVGVGAFLGADCLLVNLWHTFGWKLLLDWCHCSAQTCSQVKKTEGGNFCNFPRWFEVHQGWQCQHVVFCHLHKIGWALHVACSSEFKWQPCKNDDWWPSCCCGNKWPNSSAEDTWIVNAPGHPAVTVFFSCSQFHCQSCIELPDAFLKVLGFIWLGLHSTNASMNAEQLEFDIKCDHILAATQLTKVCGSIWFAFVFRLEFQGILGGVPPLTFTTSFHFIEVHLLFLLSQWLNISLWVGLSILHLCMWLKWEKHSCLLHSQVFFTCHHFVAWWADHWFSPAFSALQVVSQTGSSFPHIQCDGSCVSLHCVFAVLTVRPQQCDCLDHSHWQTLWVSLCVFLNHDSTLHLYLNLYPLWYDFFGEKSHPSDVIFFNFAGGYAALYCTCTTSICSGYNCWVLVDHVLRAMCLVQVLGDNVQ